MLEDSYISAPALHPRVKVYVVWERIRLTCRYRRYVILISIHNRDDLHSGLL